jgi:cold shock CspA family protein
MQKVWIGTIKFFDRANRRGMIAPEKIEPTKSKSIDLPSELYFEVGINEALRLQVGQLVQFVAEEDRDIGLVAKNVTVLSEQA